ncbi:hypothetical protein VKT23_005104 [Stygiomarasmius scandens]|uniref:Cytochrome P450 n=1 Tax=Marasmiellus scandens TaxID=2682957 RepID=A0ABR1JVE4_9AGAR
MLPATTQLLLLLASFAAYWAFTTRNRSNSNLWKIPAPKSTSWLKVNPIGAWTFHQMLMDEYSSVVRLDNKMGVSALSFVYVFDSLKLGMTGASTVYIRPKDHA